MILGRIVFARRYIKLLVAICLLLPLGYQTIAILSGSGTYPQMGLKLAQDKVTSIKNVNEYLQKIDYKSYISNAVNSVSGPKYDDDDVLKTKPSSGNHANASASQNSESQAFNTSSIPATQQLLPYLNKGGSLIEEFFYKFKYHENKKTLYSILRDNTKVYKKTLNEKISEPKVNNLKRPGKNYELGNATFMSLVRNSELEGILSAIEQVEEKFNSKFHYPWTFLNDVEFTEDFKTKVSTKLSGKAYFVTIPKELWQKPVFIDEKIEAQQVKALKDKGVGYADMESYHNMCRFYSGNFYRIPHLQNFKYYWRVEPDTKYFCSIDYDVFKFMEDNNKVYGFNINVYEGPESIPTLWNTTIEFLKGNPQYLNPNAAYDWLLEDMQLPRKHDIASYSTCHFWSNFEIADMDFFRSEAYEEWFQYLDHAGGFYYERWGDAPVHSIALGLFEDKSRIHWFRDICYEHFPYKNCPNSEKSDGKCETAEFVPWSNLNTENCMGNWIKYGLSDDEKAMF